MLTATCALAVQSCPANIEVAKQGFQSIPSIVILQISLFCRKWETQLCTTTMVNPQQYGQSEVCESHYVMATEVQVSNWEEETVVIISVEGNKTFPFKSNMWCLKFKCNNSKSNNEPPSYFAIWLRAPH